MISPCSKRDTVTYLLSPVLQTYQNQFVVEWSTMREKKKRNGSLTKLTRVTI